MRILIVEDSRAVAALMAARLASLGFEVTVAENGALALEQFKSWSPDLVFMDIEMPVMNGFEATSRIRAFEATHGELAAAFRTADAGLYQAKEGGRNQSRLENSPP